MTPILIILTLFTATMVGTLLGWVMHSHRQHSKIISLQSDAVLIKNYFAEAIKENSKLKRQISYLEDQLDTAPTDTTHHYKGIDFEAYLVFEETVSKSKNKNLIN